MERHAVPQNIMDVEFKLFGSLTVRQFGTVAATLIFAVVIYALNLPTVLSWPLIIFIIIVGLSMSFLTVNSMPFGRWFGNFVASIFSQQRKVYRKTAQAPTALTKNFAPKKASAPAVDERQLRNEAIIKSLEAKTQVAEEAAPPQFNPQLNNLKETAAAKVDDILEDDNAEQLDSYFQEAVKSNLGKYKLELHESGALINQTQASQERPLNNTLPQPAPEGLGLPRLPGNIQKSAAPVSTTPKPEAVNRFKINPNLPNPPAAAPELVPGQVVPVVPASVSAAPASTTSAQAQVLLQAEAPKPELPTPELPKPAAGISAPAIASTPVVVNAPTAEVSPMPEINIMNRLKPNQIAGYVAGVDSNPVDKAEVLIKDQAGNLLRSVFSDIKGKFIVPSVLPAGKYFIEIKKQRFRFPEYSIQLEDKPVPILKYQAA